MKYLASRFEKGKQWTEQFMMSKHRYACLPGGLSDAHSTTMGFDVEEGVARNPNPCLGLIFCVGHPSTRMQRMMKYCTSPQFIMWFFEVLHLEGIFFLSLTSVFGLPVALVAE